MTLPDQDPLAAPQYLQRSVQQQKAARSAFIVYLQRNTLAADFWLSGLHLRALQRGRWGETNQTALSLQAEGADR